MLGIAVTIDMSLLRSWPVAGCHPGSQALAPQQKYENCAYYDKQICRGV